MKSSYTLATLAVAGACLLGTACTADGDVNFSDPAVDSGAGVSTGSYTRVLTVGNFLYAVDTRSVITYDLSDRDNPVEVDRTDVGLAVETIYHLDGNLFIGSREGMFTYTIAEDGHPERRGRFDYSLVAGEVMPCDPVVANDETAFATLYTTGETDACGRRERIETLVVMDIQDLDRPSLVTTYDVRSPRGMALDGDVLVVCNDASGFTVYDVSDPQRLRVLDQVDDVMAWDAIARDGLLIVVGTEEVVQYDYADPTRLVELSRLPYARS